MDLVTAVVPTYSNVAGLKNLLTSLNKAKVPVVVVDNSNTDVVKKLCKEKKAIYLPQSSNLGFGKAVNAGAQVVKTEWMLILNDDIDGVTARVIEELIQEAKRQRWVAVSPVLMTMQGQVENMGYQVLPIGKVKLNTTKSLTSDLVLDGITAACLVIQTRVFNTLKGFDKSFFAYLEDVDLFLRLKRAGYHFGVALPVRVTHAQQTTSRALNRGTKQWHDLRGWWLLCLKHPDRFLRPAYMIAMVVERMRNASGFIKEKVSRV